MFLLPVFDSKVLEYKKKLVKNATQGKVIEVCSGPVWSAGASEEPVNIIFAGSSHSARTIDQFVRDGISICEAQLCQASRLTPDSATEMAEEVST
jgi:hypothetical protein